MGLDSHVCYAPGQCTLDPDLLTKFEVLHLTPHGDSYISFCSGVWEDFVKVATGHSLYFNLRPNDLKSMASSLDAVVDSAPDDDDAEIDAFRVPGNHGESCWVQKPCVAEVGHVKWLRDIFRLCAENGLSLEASY